MEDNKLSDASQSFVEPIRRRSAPLQRICLICALVCFVVPAAMIFITSRHYFQDVNVPDWLQRVAIVVFVAMFVLGTVLLLAVRVMQGMDFYKRQKQSGR